jgi:hypothetical protein
MTNMSPFEIRLDLLKMAKDMLESDCYAKRTASDNKWFQDVETARANGKEIPQTPAHIPFPSEEEIIRKAKLLNDFVSNGQ